MIFNPRACETQIVGQLREDLIEEGAVFGRALHDQGRGFPFETLPDWLDGIEMWRAHWKKDEVDPKFVVHVCACAHRCVTRSCPRRAESVARILLADLLKTRADPLFLLIERKL